MMGLLEILALPLIIANIVGFLIFKFTDELEDFSSVFSGNFYMPGLNILCMIMGSAGSLLALILRRDRSVDTIYKITIPAAFVIETLTLAYILLFEAGVI